VDKRKQNSQDKKLSNHCPFKVLEFPQKLLKMAMVRRSDEEIPASSLMLGHQLTCRGYYSLLMLRLLVDLFRIL
jgi:hypothetical protein